MKVLKIAVSLAVVSGFLAALALSASAEVRSSGPGPFGANGSSEIQSPGNRPMPPIVPDGPHDLWPPTGAR